MKNALHHTLNLLIVAVLLCLPLQAGAESEVEVAPVVYSSPVIITELQTGATTGSDEFVELYNVSSEPVDIEGWQVRYVNASSSTHDTTLLATINNGNDSTLLLPHTYFLLHTSTITPIDGQGNQLFTAKLSSADKAVALFAANNQTCQMEVQDVVAWGTSVDGEGLAATVLGTGDRLIQRLRLSDGQYADTNTNNYDTRVSSVVKDSTRPAVGTGATPGTDNLQSVLDEANPPTLGPGSPLAPLPIQECTLPDDPTPDPGQLETPDDSPPATIEPDEPTPAPPGPTLPASDIGLKSPQITELLPNPASPQTDAADEFIELYNSNQSTFDLSGFILQSGKRKYTFPQGTILSSHSFRAFFSAETHLGLSNTGGQVILYDPIGRIIGQTAAYATAKDNQAWALAAGTWLWTATPTPNAQNVIKAPASKKSTTKTASARTASVKGLATSKTSARNTVVSEPQTLAATEQRNPLHPGILALVAGFALLYGAYEYRSDVANKIHQFRVYRAARRETRQGTKGR